MKLTDYVKLVVESTTDEDTKTACTKLCDGAAAIREAYDKCVRSCGAKDLQLIRAGGNVCRWAIAYFKNSFVNPDDAEEWCEAIEKRADEMFWEREPENLFDELVRVATGIKNVITETNMVSTLAYIIYLAGEIVCNCTIIPTDIVEGEMLEESAKTIKREMKERAKR